MVPTLNRTFGPMGGRLNTIDSKSLKPPRKQLCTFRHPFGGKTEEHGRFEIEMSIVKFVPNL